MPPAHHRNRWLVGAAVVVLCGMGIHASVHALWALADGGRPGFAGLFRYPGWSGIHFAAGCVFAALVPVQLWAGLRARRPVLHRWGGRVACVAAVPLGSSGLALPFAMPARPLEERLFMAGVAAAFLFCLLKALRAIRARDVVRHRAWMLRTVALGLAPITQRVIFPLLVMAGDGIQDAPGFWGLFMNASWAAVATNLGVAQWLGRRALQGPQDGSRTAVQAL